MAIRKEAGLFCGSFLRKGEASAYGGSIRTLKDLKDPTASSDRASSRCQSKLTSQVNCLLLKVVTTNKHRATIHGGPLASSESLKPVRYTVNPASCPLCGVLRWRLKSKGVSLCVSLADTSETQVVPSSLGSGVHLESPRVFEQRYFLPLSRA